LTVSSGIACRDASVLLITMIAILAKRLVTSPERH